MTDALAAPVVADVGARRDGVLAWEALNLADGRRTVSQIRDALTGRYEPVPLSEVATYFDLAGGFEEPEFVDRSPAGADPLWIVTARRTQAAAD